jgi:hypothetical protein
MFPSPKFVQVLARMALSGQFGFCQDNYFIDYCLLVLVGGENIVLRIKAKTKHAPKPRPRPSTPKRHALQNPKWILPNTQPPIAPKASRVK